MLSSPPTRRLWNEMLTCPDSHPLLERITPQPEAPHTRGEGYWALVGLALCNPFTLFIASLVQVPLWLMLFAGFLVGFKIAYGASRLIAVQDKTGLFDTMKVTPTGEYGMLMCIVNAMFQRRGVLFIQDYRHDLTLHTALCLAFGPAIVFWVLAFAIFIFEGLGEPWRYLLALLVALLAGGAIALALYFDFRQSVALAVGGSLFAATFTRMGGTSRAFGMALYVGVQLLFWLGMLAGFYLFNTLDLESRPVLGVMGVAVGLVALFAIREGIIGGLSQLARRGSA